MPGLLEELKKKVNRPVAELPLADDSNTDILVKASVTPAVSASPSLVATVPSVVAAGRALTSTFQNQGDAPSCPVCGHIAVRNGACYKCLNCGESLGCS
jgi:ribonucleoside-diphosphate reductase alpha chain